MARGSSQSLVVGSQCELDNLASRSLLLAEAVWDTEDWAHRMVLTC